MKRAIGENISRQLQSPAATGENRSVFPQDGYPVQFVWSVKMLTVEKFAEAFDISEGTVWKWIENEVLRPGEHFFKKEKIYRFPWGPELIYTLMNDCYFSQKLAEEREKAIAGMVEKRSKTDSCQTARPASLPITTTETISCKKQKQSKKGQGTNNNSRGLYGAIDPDFMGKFLK